MARPTKRRKPYNERSERYTPPKLLEALDYTFDLDPCSPGKDKSFVKTVNHYTPMDDGLNQEWEGVVFVNPPTAHIASWVEKLVEHGEGIALLTLRPDAQWFQFAAEKSSTLCLVENKVIFYRGGMEQRFATGTSVALLSFGARAKEILLTADLGVCLSTDESPAWRSWEGEEEETVKEREG